MTWAPAHLAFRYVARHRRQTLLLCTALGLVLALPLSLRVLVKAAETAMRSRAVSTPQVVGARGSALDLLLASLYFKRQPLPTIPASTADEIRHTGFAQAIPLHVRYHAQQAPIVGTELDYFSFRGLRLARGHMIARLGDCVLGARLAAQRNLTPGAELLSSQEQVFDIAGTYPLKLRITGLLQPNGTADDDAIFVDLKTTWLIEGLAHGHDDLTTAPDAVLKSTPTHTVANASVRMFTEVTETNLGTFHFHGDTRAYPVTAVVVLPNDAKAEAILTGRFVKPDSLLQIIRPSQQFDLLMDSLFRMEKIVLAVLGLTTVASMAVATLVFALSFRLRQKEFQTLEDLGVARQAVVLTKLLEITLVGTGAALLAALITAVANANAHAWVRALLQ